MLSCLSWPIMSLTIILCLLSAFLFVVSVACYALNIWHQNSPVTVHTTPNEVRKMLSPPGLTQLQVLSARAVPNARLTRAFALTNTFVSANPETHTSFVRHATLLLKSASRRGWSHFQQVVVASLDAVLQDEELNLAFDTFVQDVTMRVTLVGLFDVDTAPSELDAHDIRIAGQLINHMWSLSKKVDTLPPTLLHELNTRLSRLIPDAETYPNPLDFIIPAWETLWRVVATTVANASLHTSYTTAFAEFRNTPTMAQLRSHSDSEPSVEWFITETMRLYPPSKHITRSFRPIFWSSSLIPLVVSKAINRSFGTLMSHRECADIGSVLRSQAIWGSDADKFDPLRFRPDRLTLEQERNKLLAFSHGPNSCVAVRWAPMAAAIISAEMVDRLKPDSRFKLIQGPVIGARDGWTGWMVKG